MNLKNKTLKNETEKAQIISVENLNGIYFVA